MESTTRGDFWRKLIFRRWVVLVALTTLVLSTVTFWWDELFTPYFGERPRIIQFLAHVPVWCRVLLGAVAAVFLIGETAFRAIKDKETLLKETEAKLSELQKPGLGLHHFHIIDIQREVIGEYPRYATDVREYHIFVRIETQIDSPSQAEVTRYRLELNFHGLEYSPEEHSDVEDWEMTIAQHHSGTVQLDIIPLRALPTALTAGLPHEGWLHFKTNAMTENQLLGSRPRLYMETADEFRYAELSEHSPLWNNNKHFKKKNSTSAGGLTSPASSC
jgi:hypothetical protein